jgi:hypothetical protein
MFFQNDQWFFRQIEHPMLVNRPTIQLLFKVSGQGLFIHPSVLTYLPNY